MTGHSELSPSSAHRWLTCHASVALSRGVVEQESAAAQEGTLAHALLEHRLIHGDVPEGAYTDEMVEGSEVVLSYLGTREEEFEIWPETKVSFGSLLPDGTFGTSDVILWYPESRTLEVIDYKFGRGVVVDPEENEQMTLYAIGALVTQKLPVPKVVRLTIIQPRAHHERGPVRSWDTDISYLVEFGKRVREAVPLIYGNDPQFSPSEDACRFCPGAFKCPALKKLAIERAMQEFEALPEDGDLKDLADSLDVSRMLRIWQGAVEDHALRLALAGQTIPGYKLVEGQSRRKWIDENKVIEFFKRRKIPVKDFMPPSLLGIPAAEKLLKRRKVDPSVLKEYVTKPEGKKKLAPISDSRGEVDADFSALD